MNNWRLIEQEALYSMIRYILKMKWLMIVMIVLLLFTGLRHFMASSPKTTNNQTNHASSLQLKKAIPSHYPDLDLSIKTKETDNYKLTIQSLTTHSKLINSEIDAWIRIQKQAFLANVPDDSDKQAELDITLEIQKQSDYYYSFIMQTKVTQDEENHRLHTKVFNVDLDQEKLLTLEDMLKNNDSALQAIRELTQENLRDQTDMSINEEALQDTLSSPDTWNWSMNKEGLTLMFGGEMSAERSEEHTSELQSRGHLVCRLLLEKKNKGILRH